MVCFLHDGCMCQKDLISLFSLSQALPSLFFCSLLCFSLSSLCRGGAFSDGWGSQADPDPARRDGERVAMLVVLLWVRNQTDCGPVGLESQYMFGYLILSSTQFLIKYLLLYFSIFLSVGSGFSLAGFVYSCSVMQITAIKGWQHFPNRLPRRVYLALQESKLTTYGCISTEHSTLIIMQSALWRLFEINIASSIWVIDVKGPQQASCLTDNRHITIWLSVNENANY